MAKSIDFEELLRYPKKGDPVLPSPAPFDRYGGDPADACAFGYRRAARILAEDAFERGDEVFLLYPVVFLYRHHVELMLKNLIYAFDHPSVRQKTGAEELDETDRQNLSNGKKAHSLQRLWGQLLPVVKALGNDIHHSETVEGISSYIQQLNEIDPDSVSFRYTTAIAGTKAKLRKAQKRGAEVNIQTFAKAMERLANYLEGLDGYASAIIEAHDDMIAEAHDNAY
jgi:hypothetical protein